ncbi:MAG: hypothetical protein U0792_23765 [Gemmataceae bacterium]
MNFSDDLHCRYIEVTGLTGTCCSRRLQPRGFCRGVGHQQSSDVAAAATSKRAAEPAGLITHAITPETTRRRLREGLLKDKDNYLGVLMRWK